MASTACRLFCQSNLSLSLVYTYKSLCHAKWKQTEHFSCICSHNPSLCLGKKLCKHAQIQSPISHWPLIPSVQGCSQVTSSNLGCIVWLKDTLTCWQVEFVQKHVLWCKSLHTHIRITGCPVITFLVCFLQ